MKYCKTCLEQVVFKEKAIDTTDEEKVKGHIYDKIYTCPTCDKIPELKDKTYINKDLLGKEEFMLIKFGEFEKRIAILEEILKIEKKL